MASAHHLKSLIKSHIDGDENHFYSVAMQMAAHEARLGHGKLAQELRALIDEAKKNKPSISSANKPIPLTKPRGELDMTSGRIQGRKGAAAIIGVHPNTLRHRMRKLGIIFGRGQRLSL